MTVGRLTATATKWILRDKARRRGRPITRWWVEIRNFVSSSAGHERLEVSGRLFRPAEDLGRLLLLTWLPPVVSAAAGFCCAPHRSLISDLHFEPRFFIPARVSISVIPLCSGLSYEIILVFLNSHWCSSFSWDLCVTQKCAHVLQFHLQVRRYWQDVARLVGSLLICLFLVIVLR